MGLPPVPTRMLGSSCPGGCTLQAAPYRRCDMRGTRPGRGGCSWLVTLSSALCLVGKTLHT